MTTKKYLLIFAFFAFFAFSSATNAQDERPNINIGIGFETEEFSIYFNGPTQRYYHYRLGPQHYKRHHRQHRHNHKRHNWRQRAAERRMRRHMRRHHQHHSHRPY